jgi:hypothetical protein
MTNNPTYYALLEACSLPGCPICRLEEQYVERYLRNQFYENINYPGLRDDLRQSLGFCQAHAWLAVNQRLGDALGFAIIYHDVVGNALKRLDSDVPPPNKHWTGMFRRIPEQLRTLVYKAVYVLTPKKACPACRNQEEMQSIILWSLAENLGQPELISALKESEGLCIPHLRSALQAMQDVAAFEKLLTIHREKWETLEDELAEFIRKNDYRFVKEGFGAEGTAWRRAISMIAGGGMKK